MSSGPRGRDLFHLRYGLTLLAVALFACGPSHVGVPSDPHSFANFQDVQVTHLKLELTVDFEAQSLVGSAVLHLKRENGSRELILDTRDLEIRQVVRGAGESEEPAEYELGAAREILGRPLRIELGPETTWVRIDYRTLTEAAALQWLAPEQTRDRLAPFLFTQSQAILARTWVPCQDTPAVRMTYDAEVQVPPGLLALMSASNPQHAASDGRYRFVMSQPIPSYLLALAVGRLEFRSLSERTGVYAEPSLVDAAAWEFADTEEMMAAAEALYGPYRWERYDMLVLPPSFPYGGMENPRLTFLTPTILAGDRSLVALVAHELAHSWSGNLVTNATWDDFWLNEGFTSYLESRIMEEVYGPVYERMLARLALDGLVEFIEEVGADHPETRLKADLAGGDPDAVGSEIAYDKGQFFLRTMEHAVGRDRWDAFLRGYFTRHAFESITTETFVAELKAKLGADVPSLDRLVDVDEWVYGTGLPSSVPTIESTELEKVEEELKRWSQGDPAEQLRTEEWTTHHWLHFLRNLPEDIPRRQLEALDRRFGFTDIDNSEILHQWLLIGVHNWYEPVLSRVSSFLREQGRRKFLVPLYRALAASERGRELALQIYREARATYHPVSATSVDELLGVGGRGGGVEELRRSD